MAANTKVLSIGEFATLTALLFSIVALSIDAMLPAFPAISSDLFIANENDVQLVIGLFFLGNGVGQLLFGPLSDSFGRPTYDRIRFSGVYDWLCHVNDGTKF